MSALVPGAQGFCAAVIATGGEINDDSLDTSGR
jgi:hypothetical protein